MSNTKGCISAPWRTLFALALVVVVSATLAAEDWPEIRGNGRLGVWNETGVLERFPKEGLKVLWRTPVRRGYSGPAVAGGRVFVTDFVETQAPKGTERAVALDEKTGKILWTREWDTDYRGIGWANGPRATPTVDGSQVYVLGAAGHLLALDVRSGDVLWQKDFVKDLGADPGRWGNFWGFASSPIVEGRLLICFAGANPNGKVVAFDKATGKEVWRALSGESDLGVAQPIVVTAGGVRQLIAWHPAAVVSLDPLTGREYWTVPYAVGASMNVATPVQHDDMMFLSNFYTGGLMLRLDSSKPGATVAWKGTSASEIQTDGLHAVTTTPVILGNFLYGICSYGQFRCLRRDTGERVWESQAVTKERARWASGQIIRHGDRLFVNNDRGELLILRPAPDGYQEVDRTALIKPTTAPGNRRALINVNWSHPAYANRNIYARNDEEIISVSLAAR